MEEHPLITIIVAVYNTHLYLAQCLQSIIEQTYTNWELIIIDDGSTDGSSAICDEYAVNDSRIEVVHKGNTGKADSCNMAIERSKGTYVLFIDSDDWIAPATIEILLQAIRRTGKDVAVCGHWNEFEDERIESPVSTVLIEKQCKEAVEMFYDRKMYSCIWGKLFNKKLLQEPIPDYVEHEDHAVIYKWVARGNGMALCPESLYHYRQRMSSIMGQHANNDLSNLVPVIEECYWFIESNQLFTAAENKRIALRQIMTLAKEIARNSHYTQDESETKLQHIRDFVMRLQPVKKTEIDKKTYRRMQYLLKSTTLFRCLMRLSQIFIVKRFIKKRKTYVLFA